MNNPDLVPLRSERDFARDAATPVTARGGRGGGIGSHFTSLRSRIVLWYLALFALALIVSVIALRQFLVVSLDNMIEDSLTQEAEELRVFAQGDDPSTGRPFGDDVKAIVDNFLESDIDSAGEGAFFLIDGQRYKSSRGTPVNLFDDPALVEQWGAITEPTSGEVDTDAGPARWFAVPITSGNQTLGTFIVARFYQPELAEINRAVRSMALIAGGTLLIVSVIGWLTVGSAIAPIRRLTRTAQNISESHLSERLPVESNDEVGEMTETFNNMLDRLEAAFVDQRRFLDDIGHELRTPLTIVRGHLELMPEDAKERESTLALCLDELDRMNRYVNELILLAKSERPDFLRFGAVDLAELTEGMRVRATALEPERTWQVDDVAHSVIEADSDRLNQAWLNLVNNAVQHTSPGGVIALGSTVVDGHARMWVRDVGPGVSVAEQDHIFERFGRGADTQTRRSEGTGLGLAIVNAIARAHGGWAYVDSRPGQGARFTIIVPIAPPAEADDEVHDDLIDAEPTHASDTSTQDTADPSTVDANDITAEVGRR